MKIDIANAKSAPMGRCAGAEVEERGNDLRQFQNSYLS
jgi:hypothetical protein